MSKECAIQTIVDTFEAIDNNANKRKYIESVLTQCGKCELPPSPAPTEVVQKKKKRAMSGYNCYLKICAKTTDMNFQECLRNKGWAKLSNAEKDTYKNLAKKDCPITE